MSNERPYICQCRHPAAQRLALWGTWQCKGCGYEIRRRLFVVADLDADG